MKETTSKTERCASCGSLGSDTRAGFLVSYSYYSKKYLFFGKKKFTQYWVCIDCDFKYF